MSADRPKKRDASTLMATHGSEPRVAAPPYYGVLWSRSVEVITYVDSDLRKYFTCA